MIHIEYFIVNSFMERCSIVWDDDRYCAIVDPGCASEEEILKVVSFISEHDLHPECIMLTHAHFDHIYGMSALAEEYNIPVYAHMNELSTLESTNPYVCRCYGLPLPETFPMIKRISEASIPSRFIQITERDTIEVGSLRFNVLETPGHTPGGVCFLERNEKILFTGDTLFAGSIGRTDHPGGDYDALMKGIFEKLMVLDGDIKVIPGHGPLSEIAQERTTNPFLQPFNEPYEN